MNPDFSPARPTVWNGSSWVPLDVQQDGWRTIDTFFSAQTWPNSALDRLISSNGILYLTGGSSDGYLAVFYIDPVDFAGVSPTTELRFKWSVISQTPPDTTFTIELKEVTSVASGVPVFGSDLISVVTPQLDQPLHSGSSGVYDISGLSPFYAAVNIDPAQKPAGNRKFKIVTQLEVRSTND